jgi:NTP pyrophosphatase (non-canonical NTP hydrolase)
MEKDRRMITLEDIESFQDKEPLSLDEYQERVMTTAIYKDKILYTALGLCGEAGEVAEKIKKWLRDGELDDIELAKELGDVMWYVAALSNDLGYDLSEIAEMNLIKLLEEPCKETVTTDEQLSTYRLSILYRYITLCTMA